MLLRMRLRLCVGRDEYCFGGGEGSLDCSVGERSDLMGGSITGGNVNAAPRLTSTTILKRLRLCFRLGGL